MLKTKVTVYRLPWSSVTEFSEARESWNVSREPGFSYESELEGEHAAEEAFHLTNAPLDYLNDEQQNILKEQDFKGPALSVGDIVRVATFVRGQKMPEYFLCKSYGWEKYNGDVIELLKFLL